MIREITRKLYADTPRETLYHYTTFTGLLGIIGSRSLWASDIRYMNDSAELKHTADLIRKEITKRITAGHPNPNLLNQFLDWISHRMTNGHLLFGTSFRSNGNLLSQWRGYSRLGKGVSIGFTPEYIQKCAQSQTFQIGKCIYHPKEQQMLIGRVIDAVEHMAGQCKAKTSSTGPSYSKIFKKMESDLLRLAAVLKHPSYEEEAEWRIVSPVITDYLNADIHFRQGESNLIPYVEFKLSGDLRKPVVIEHIYLGPTPNITISMNSLNMYLTKNGVTPNQGIDYCQIPYRQK